MLLVHKFFAMLILLGMIIYGIWVVTIINDPACSAPQEVAGGATRILKALAFCWLG